MHLRVATRRWLHDLLRQLLVSIFIGVACSGNDLAGHAFRFLKISLALESDAMTF